MLPRLPFAFARRHKVLLREDEQSGRASAVFGGDGELPPEILIEVRRFLGRPFAIEAVAEGEFDLALQEAYESQRGNLAEMDLDLGGADSLASVSQSLEDEPVDLLENVSDAPVIRFLNALIAEAARERASDIHIEPYESRLRVRLRVDGTMRDALDMKATLAPALASRVKVMAQMDIAERRVPQDGRISIRIGGRAIDMRVATIPTAAGERISIRLLDNSAARFNLNALGMPASVRDVVTRLTQRSHGVFLVTGPTGAGKTTTLYASLARLETRRLNVMTIEDPIEYRFDGVNQTQVNALTGMTFSRGLRSILRHDPDIVLVGEIRDRETAIIAVQASLTGHLVLSTLHTNSSAGAITRLRDIGIEPFLISSGLAGVLAQRLARTLCPQCRRERPATDAERRVAGVSLESVFDPVGCDDCGGGGYAGRIGIFELLEINDEARRLIHDGGSEQEIADAALPPDLRLRAQAFDLAKRGKTSITEAVRITEA